MSQTRSRRERVDGVLLLDKQIGLTSNAALQKARRLLNADKAGHTGTLDPLATGLLPLTFGEATKFSADLLEADKAYEATLKLGERTTTGDAEGAVIEQREVVVDRDQLEAVLSRMLGTIEQIPPMYSALKRDGKALYEYARQGIELERVARPVQILKLQLMEFDGVCVKLSIDCSKGTYVRVLAEDIGAALNCGAHLTALRRTRVGPLKLEDAVTLQTLETSELSERRSQLLPTDALLASLNCIHLDAVFAARFCQGQRLAIDAEPRNERVKVLGPGKELLGVAKVTEYGVLAPERLISNQV